MTKLNSKYPATEQVENREANVMGKLCTMKNSEGQLVVCVSNYSLTTREIEALNLISKGMVNKEIAKQLYISEKTVKNHVNNIFKKLNVSNRVEAVIFALQNNIVTVINNK